MSKHLPTDEFEDRPELVRKRAQAAAATRALTVMWLAIVAVVLVFMLYDIQIAREQRQHLLDCTMPEGKCFQESQKRTATVVKALIDEGLLQELATRKIVILASQCADEAETQTAREIERCIDVQLDKEKEAQ
jgi:hypothetical protein